MDAECTNEDIGPRKPFISPARRRELLALAEELAVWVEEKTQPHERCHIRRMVEMMVDA